MKNIYQLICFLLFFILKIFPYSTHHFYGASSLWQEPRFERNGLSTFELEFLGGSTNKSFNCKKERSNLLDINYPIKLNNKSGYFELLEANLTLTQNISPWLFLQAYIPLRESHIYTHIPPNNCFSEINLGNTIFTQKKAGLADIALLSGFTKNYINTEYLDYIDLSIQTGITLPTGKKRNPDLIFDYSLGYNGLIGIPLILDLSIGAYDWLTLAFHIDYLFFSEQNKINWGNIHQFGLCIKADHAIRGFSLLFGFSNTEKTSNFFNKKKIITNNPSLNPWNMTTFNFSFEYDFSEYYCRYAPRISFIYNKILKGTNIFKTNLKGGLAALELNWIF